MNQINNLKNNFENLNNLQLIRLIVQEIRRQAIQEKVITPNEKIILEVALENECK